MIKAGKLFDGMQGLVLHIKEYSESKNSEIQLGILNKVLYIGWNSGKNGLGFEPLYKTPDIRKIKDWIKLDWKEPDDVLNEIQEVKFCKPKENCVMHAEMNIIHYLCYNKTQLDGTLYLVGSKPPCKCCRYIIDEINKAKKYGLNIEIPDGNLFKVSPETNPSEWTNPFESCKVISFPTELVSRLSNETKDTILSKA